MGTTPNTPAFVSGSHSATILMCAGPPYSMLTLSALREGGGGEEGGEGGGRERRKVKREGVGREGGREGGEVEKKNMTCLQESMK